MNTFHTKRGRVRQPRKEETAGFLPSPARQQWSLEKERAQLQLRQQKMLLTSCVSVDSHQKGTGSFNSPSSRRSQRPSSPPPSLPSSPPPSLPSPPSTAAERRAERRRAFLQSSRESDEAIGRARSKSNSPRVERALQ